MLNKLQALYLIRILTRTPTPEEQRVADARKRGYRVKRSIFHARVTTDPESRED